MVLKLHQFIKKNQKIEKNTCIEMKKKVPHKSYETLWSARENASVALSAEQERHTENNVRVFLIIKLIINKN